MLTDSIAPQQGSLVDAAKERIQSGPLPDWVVPCSFPPDFRPETPGQVTYLLWDKQLHAEKYQAYTHIAIRLETLQAVQRESDWRIEFDPRHQKITLHWIRIHRGDQQFDQTRPAYFRPAAGVGESRRTLALLLEDVRLGDILEWCYTIEERPTLMAGRCACFFAVPEYAHLGKLFVSVRFNADRKLKWKSSAKDLVPAEAQGKNDVQWVWARDNVAGSSPEENMPAWQITHPWIQVSDCGDWETVAADFALAWNESQETAADKPTAPESPAAEDVILEQAEKTVNLVQDEFRCLAEAAELDAEPPASPETVSRRRFGTSKDLSFLLVHKLRELGLSARTVLVNTNIRKSLRDLLPAPGLFNHVIVEFDARGQRHWIDATARGQGGGLLNRLVPEYGVGLPVANVSSGLVPAPAPSVSQSAYEVKETILLDTAGASSLLGIVVIARGSHAEALRRDFDSLGAEAISRRRLQSVSERFGTATRSGPLDYRDNRKSNEFFLAEIFEIRDFLQVDAKAGWYKLNVTDPILLDLLKLPDSKTRRAPFALPHPCDATHVFEVYCVALAPGVAPEKTTDNPWFQFTLSRKLLAGNWVVKSTLWTLADSVPAEGMDEYRASVQEVRAQSAWSLVAPAGLARPHQRTDFGTLPAFWDSAGAVKRAPMKASFPTAPDSSGASASQATTGQPGEIRYKRRKRHRRRRRENKSIMFWGVCVAAVMLILLVLLILELSKGAQQMLPPTQSLPDQNPAPAPPPAQTDS